MCVILDACVINIVFNAQAETHESFKPVLDLIRNNKNGKIIYGGTKYKRELKRAIGTKFISIISELDRAGKIIRLSDQAVNRTQHEVEQLEEHPDFDDPHLVAIVIVSGCKILCTTDKRATRFLKDQNLYPKSTMRPKIYSDRRNLPVLRDTRNIAPICCE